MNSPNLITKLAIDEVFVFGSNLEGRHGKGAAKQALQWGAVYGKGVGASGKTYAIPTRKFVLGDVPTIGARYFDGRRSIVTLPLDEILTYVTAFYYFCTTYPKFKFLVTPIGCSNAGYKPEQIAHLFAQCIHQENILLPKCFTNVIYNPKP